MLGRVFRSGFNAVRQFSTNKTGETARIAGVGHVSQVFFWM